jgi:3'(2'), 5'-bisphosphate nucleotidase
MSDFAHELKIALEAVRRASLVCRSVQTGIGPEAIEKKNATPVTIADFASQAVVCRAIKDVFPDDPIIGEEDSAELQGAEGEHHLPLIQKELAAVGHSTDPERIYESIDFGGSHDYAPRFWTIDPIDGTKGFLRKEQYAVSLALAIEGELQVGLLGCPNLPLTAGSSSPVGAIFYAVRGQGAYVIPLDQPDAEPVRIHVSGIADPALTRMCESVESGHSSHDDSAELAKRVGIAGKPTRLDSQAKYAVVGRGEAEIYLRLPTRPGYRERIWDHGGGVVVVQEAGGTVTDVFGAPLDFGQGYCLEKNRGVVVSNGKLHDRIIKELDSLGIRDKAV